MNEFVATRKIVIEGNALELKAQLARHFKEMSRREGAEGFLPASGVDQEVAGCRNSGNRRSLSSGAALRRHSCICLPFCL